MVSILLLRVITAPPGPRLGVSPGDIPWSRCKAPAYAIDVRPVHLPPGASWIRHIYPSPSRGLPGRRREYSGQPNAAYSPIGLRPDSRRLVLVSIPGLSLFESIVWYLLACGALEAGSVPPGRLWPGLGPCGRCGPAGAGVGPSGSPLSFLTSYSLRKLGVTPGHSLFFGKFSGVADRLTGAQAGSRATPTRRREAAMAAAAAPGSGARVIGRPITSRSAPASRASSGVATRAWS